MQTSVQAVFVIDVLYDQEPGASDMLGSLDHLLQGFPVNYCTVAKPH